MDLTLLIVLVLAGLLILYLINTVKNLIDEIREMKQSCLPNKNFTKNTKDTMNNIQTDVVSNLKYLQKYFD